MSNTISERDAVKRERVAAARMRCAVLHEMDWEGPIEGPCAQCTKRAKEVHPLPKIARPRVLKDPHEDGFVLWRAGLDDSFPQQQPCIEVLADGDAWHKVDPLRRRYITPQRVALWADLLANPTEECEDDS